MDEFLVLSLKKTNTGCLVIFNKNHNLNIGSIIEGINFVNRDGHLFENFNTKLQVITIDSNNSVTLNIDISTLSFDNYTFSEENPHFINLTVNSNNFTPFSDKYYFTIQNTNIYNGDILRLENHTKNKHVSVVIDNRYLNNSSIFGDLYIDLETIPENSNNINFITILDNYTSISQFEFLKARNLFWKVLKSMVIQNRNCPKELY